MAVRALKRKLPVEIGAMQKPQEKPRLTHSSPFCDFHVKIATRCL
jgi:hypothetical protein